MILLESMISLEGEKHGILLQIACINFPSVAIYSKADQSHTALFLQVACIKTIGYALRHVANGKALDCFGYADPREKRNGLESPYSAKDFDYALSVL